MAQIIRVDITSVVGEKHCKFCFAPDLDECLWEGSNYFLQKCGFKDGFMAIHTGRMVEHIPENPFSSAIPGAGWAYLRLPLTKKGCCKKEEKENEEEILRLVDQIIDKSSPEEIIAKKIEGHDCLAFLFSRTIGGKCIPVGIIILYGANCIYKNLDHEMMLFFRHACEKLAFRFWRQICEVTSLEQELRKIKKIQDFWALFMKHAKRATEATSGTIMEMNRIEGSMKFIYFDEVWADRHEEKLKKAKLCLNSIAGWVVQNQKAKIIGNRDDIRPKDASLHYQEILSKEEDLKYTSMLVVPVIFQGVTIGAISLEHPDEDHFFDTDIYAVTMIAERISLHWEAYLKIKMAEDIDKACKRVLEPEYAEFLKKFVEDTKGDFGALQIYRPDESCIETVEVANINPDWASIARHLLWENDIQVDIWRKMQMEIIAGEDERFDPFIYKIFHHCNLLRIWIPLVVEKNINGEIILVDMKINEIQKIKKTSADDRHEVIPLEFERKTPEAKLECIGTLEIGYRDRTKKVVSTRGELEELINKVSLFLQDILPFLPQTVYRVFAEKSLQLSVADCVYIQQNEKDILCIGSASFPPGYPMSQCLQSFEDKLNQEKKEYLICNSEWEVKNLSPQLAEAGVKSLAYHRLSTTGGLLFCYCQKCILSQYEYSLFRFMAREIAKFLQNMEEERILQIRRKIILNIGLLESQLLQNMDIEGFHDQLCKILVRMLIADGASFYFYDSEKKDFINPKRYPIDLSSSFIKLETEDKKNLKPENICDTKTKLVPGSLASFRITIGSRFSDGDKAAWDQPYGLLYLHIHNLNQDKEKIKRLIEILPLAIGRIITSYKLKKQTEKQMEIFRKLASLDPSDMEGVFRVGVEGFRLLDGYRGCAFCFRSENNEELILEHVDFGTMFVSGTEPTSIPRKIPLIKMEITETVKIDTDENKEIAYKIERIGNLKQLPLNLFPFREGCENFMIRTWPDDARECDHALLLDQIVLVKEAGYGLSEEDKSFLGSLAIHIHMGIKEARIEILSLLPKELKVTLNLKKKDPDLWETILQNIHKHLHNCWRTVLQGIPMEEEFLGIYLSDKKSVFLKAKDSYLLIPKIEEGRIENFLQITRNAGNIGKDFSPSEFSLEPFGLLIAFVKDKTPYPGHTAFSNQLLQVAAQEIIYTLKYWHQIEDLTLKAAILGHNVNAPLQGIMDFAKESQEILETSSPDLYSVKMNQKNILELVRMAKDQVLASLSETSAESEIKLSKLLKNVVNKFKTMAEREGIEVNLVDIDSPPFKINAAKLEAILTALLDNAIKYSYPKKEVRIVLKSFDDPYRYRLEISNFGIGIPSEYNEKMFQPGMKVGKKILEKRYSAGSGLGLVVVKAYSEELGLRIDYDSKCVGKYDTDKKLGKYYLTTFFLDFPKTLFERKQK